MNVNSGYFVFEIVLYGPQSLGFAVLSPLHMFLYIFFNHEENFSVVF